MSFSYVAYVGSLHTHALMRWLLLLLGILLLWRMAHGLRRGRSWERADEALAVVFMGAVDVQLLLGLALHQLLSPIVQGAWSSGMAAIFATPPLWFFSLVHPLLMLLGIVVAHVGRAQSKRAPEDAQKFKLQLRSLLLWLSVVIVAMPWPWLPYGRPFIHP